MDNDGAKLLKENQFIISVPLIVAEQQFLRNEPRVGKEKFCFFFRPKQGDLNGLMRSMNCSR